MSNIQNSEPADVVMPLKTQVQEPSVGRIVHYFEFDSSDPVAAIVTELNPYGPDPAMRVALTLFKPGMAPMARGSMVPWRGGPGVFAPFWDWPPRV